MFTVLTLEVGGAVVEEHDADGAAVVLVHHPCAGVYEVLDRQPRSRRDAGVRAGRARNGQVRGDDGLAPRGDHHSRRTASADYRQRTIGSTIASSQHSRALRAMHLSSQQSLWPIMHQTTGDRE